MPFDFGDKPTMNKPHESSSSGSNPFSNAFSDKPKVGGQFGSSLDRPSSFDSDLSRSNRVKASTSAPKPHLRMPDIPWTWVAIGVAVVVAIALLVIFRDPITEFLVTALSWVITVVIIVAIAIIGWRVLGNIFWGRRR